MATKLKELLESIPGLSPWKVEPNSASFHPAFDLLASGKLPHGPRIELYVDCHLDPRPSRFPYVAIERKFEKESAKLIRASVFAAPYVSPRMAEICESHGWSWFDLAGNCRITVPTFLHLERRGNEPVHETPRPSANLSTPEAGRVVRALLAPQNAKTPWTQRHLAEHYGKLDKPVPEPSLGLVNKVVRFLRDEAFIEDLPEGGFHLVDPVKLLFAWRDAYRFDRHEQRGYFTLLQASRLREVLAGLDSEAAGFAAYASFSAAELQAPHVRQPKTWLFLDARYIPVFEKRTEAKLVDSGENMIVLVPDDAGVFYLVDGGVINERRMGCTNAVQTYVDLWHSGGRGKEAAEALLDHKLKPEWKALGLKA